MSIRHGHWNWRLNAKIVCLTQFQSRLLVLLTGSVPLVWSFWGSVASFHVWVHECVILCYMICIWFVCSSPALPPPNCGNMCLVQSKKIVKMYIYCCSLLCTFVAVIYSDVHLLLQFVEMYIYCCNLLRCTFIAVLDLVHVLNIMVVVLICYDL